MRHLLLFISLFSCLQLSAVPHAQAAAKGIAVKETEEVPAVNWGLVGKGFSETFKARREEVEAAEPNRFFPGTVAFALRGLDNSGHFLMLKCAPSDSCSTKRDELEDRMVFTTLLDSVRTPKARKSDLYNGRTWELTPLGQKYMNILMKRYPDLPKRIGRLINSSMPER